MQADQKFYNVNHHPLVAELARGSGSLTDTNNRKLVAESYTYERIDH